MKTYLSAYLLLLLGAAFQPDTPKVTLDCYFNHEIRKTQDGKSELYHYLWTEKDGSGFSRFSDAFVKAGGQPDTLGEPPTESNLKGSSVYIIVDPDTKKENPHPRYITSNDANIIAGWVHNGGVLLMMANDSANVELPHFNTLAAKFGLHFNNDLQNHVRDDQHFADGSITINDNTIFKTAKKIFIKDACSITVTAAPTMILRNSNNATVMAAIKYGKGTVFAVGDPWLYNEYTNGRLPAGFENDKAANDLAAWLLKQAVK